VNVAAAGAAGHPDIDVVQVAERKIGLGPGSPEPAHRKFPPLGGVQRLDWRDYTLE
jgi:hypothetical protein